MVLDFLKRTKKVQKEITADQRASIRAMVDEGYSNEEIKAEFPDVPFYFLKNIKSATTKDTKVGQIAKEFQALAELQSAMRDSDRKQRDFIREELLDQLADSEGSESSTDDKLVNMFLDMVAKGKLPQQPQQPVQQTPPESNAPVGAIPLTQVPDEELKTIIQTEIPSFVIKLIKKGTIKKSTAWDYVQKKGLDLETFDRAWKLIKEG